MRIYRYWCEKKADIILPDGVTAQPTKVFGYSNHSMEEAQDTAELLMFDVQRRVNGERVEWNYDQKPIREEILRELSPRNIVTRNRYGAEVLNSEELIFVDVDGGAIPQSVWGKLACMVRRTEQSCEVPEEEMMEFFRKVAAKTDYRRSPIRVYRTRNGYRLLLTRGDFPPGSGRLKRLMRHFNADELYASLCHKQGCFRARLTPKPDRINHHTRKFLWPRPADAESEVAEWLNHYHTLSEPYAVCRYIGTLNDIKLKLDAATRYHDERTRAFSGLPLA